MNLTQKLRQLHTDITASGDRLKIVDAWTLAERLLGRFPLDGAEIDRVVREKDADGLLSLIEQIENPGASNQPEALPEFEASTLDAAMKAFRKRLKVMRLSDESRLGGRYTSGGRTSKIDAIEPPSEFDPKIWRVLAAKGELKDTGQGFYSLPE